MTSYFLFAEDVFIILLEAPNLFASQTIFIKSGAVRLQIKDDHN